MATEYLLLLLTALFIFLAGLIYFLPSPLQNKLLAKKLSFILLTVSIVFLVTGCPPPPPKDPCLSALAASPSPTSSPTVSPTVEDKSPVMLILDVSGSMDKPVSSKSQTKKIDDAKNVVTKIVNDSRSNSFDIGFTALGHKNATCSNNVEVFSGIKNNKDIIPMLSKLKPKGETPLAEAIQKVGTNLKGQRGNSTIVLVSDGEESCKGNPCDVVKSLKQSGINFIFNAVAYGTNLQTNEQLKCLTDEGKGKLYTPNNVENLQKDLNEALFGFGQMVVGKPENGVHAKGWKLYEKGAIQKFKEPESVKTENAISSTNENLWQPQNVFVGNYDFCLYFEDKDIPAIIKEVKIIKDQTTNVDPR